MSAPTVKFAISAFILYECSGSDISAPGSGSGYSEHLAEQLAHASAGKLDLTAEDLRDLAEFLDAMYHANAQNGNTSGARSCEKHADRARAAARELDAVVA